MFLGGLEILIAKALLGFAIGAAVVTVVAISIAVIESLFDKWRQKHVVVNQDQQDQIGFLLNEGIDSGKYKSVQGVFNKRTKKVEDAWRIQSNQIEPDLKDEKVVIFD
jgi:hypothetical protein